MVTVSHCLLVLTVLLSFMVIPVLGCSDFLLNTRAPEPEGISTLLQKDLELTKLRISGASTFTAAAGYVACLRGADAGLVTTLIGILLLAMGSSALNEVQERRYDAMMPRTAGRPIPHGDISAGRAALVAVILAVSGFLVLLAAHNLTSALLGALALGFGMFVDNSIVVFENILRLREGDFGPHTVAGNDDSPGWWRWPWAPGLVPRR